MTRMQRRWLVCVLWVAIGLLLIWRGLPYAGFRAEEGIVALSGLDRYYALGLAFVVGVGKGFTALRKGARRIAGSIERAGERAPAWSVFSPFMIVLVALMIGAGLALRLSPYDPVVKAWIVGVLYPAIGLALIIGGRLVLHAQPLAD